jgi:hypothetical protein
VSPIRLGIGIGLGLGSIIGIKLGLEPLLIALGVAETWLGSMIGLLFMLQH